MAGAANIDRLLLDIPGGSAAQGRQVAALVAAGLAAAAGGMPETGDLPRLRIDIVGDHRTDPEVLARRIVAETLRALARGS